MDSKPASQIDEAWFGDYVEFGWGELFAYLAKWACFARYLVENQLEEDHVQDP